MTPWRIALCLALVIVEVILILFRLGIPGFWLSANTCLLQGFLCRSY